MSVGFEYPSPILSIDPHWETVFEDSTTQFHNFSYSKTATPDSTDPQIYRWVLKGSNGRPGAVYIGQSQNMRARLEGYRNGMPSRPKDQLNRIREKFEETEAAGGKIQLQLRFAPFSLNGIVFSQESLSYEPTRHILENPAICLIRLKGIAVRREIYK